MGIRSPFYWGKKKLKNILPNQTRLGIFIPDSNNNPNQPNQ